MKAIVLLIALTLGTIGSPLAGIIHIQGDIPQKVADKPGMIYTFPDLPEDGKPHRLVRREPVSGSTDLMVKMPSLIDNWQGEYHPDGGDPVSGVGKAMVMGTKTVFKDRGVEKYTNEYVFLYLEVEPKADLTKLGTVLVPAKDAKMLAQYMGECIRLAKAWNAPDGKVECYPRRIEVGKLTAAGEDTLTLAVDQLSQNTPAEVNFESTNNNVTVYTKRLEDVDILRRQVRRVNAWVDNRPYIP